MCTALPEEGMVRAPCKRGGGGGGWTPPPTGADFLEVPKKILGLNQLAPKAPEKVLID